MTKYTLWRIEGQYKGKWFCAGAITRDPSFLVIKAAPILRQLIGRHIAVALASYGNSIKAIQRWTENEKQHRLPIP